MIELLTYNDIREAWDQGACLYYMNGEGGFIEINDDDELEELMYDEEIFSL